MRKLFLVLAFVIAALLVFNGCAAEIPSEEGGAEEYTPTYECGGMSYTNPLLIEASSMGLITDQDEAPDDAPLKTFTGVVLYVYKYYAFVVGSYERVENVGVEIYKPYDYKFDLRDYMSFGDSVTVTGKLYIRNYSGRYELRLDVTDPSSITNNGAGSLPTPILIPKGCGLDEGLFGAFVEVSAVYEGIDDYDNYIFDNSGEDIEVFKYSEVGDLEVGKRYDLKGIVGQNYGYKLFIATNTFVTPQE